MAFIPVLYKLQYELIEPLNLLFESPYKPTKWKMVMLLQCTKMEIKSLFKLYTTTIINLTSIISN